MNDLRIALLAVGAAVVVVLVGWEWFQRRAARRAEKDLIAGPLGRKPDGTEVHDDPLFESPRGNDRARVEPSISFDGVGADEHDSDAREPVREPPLVRIEEAEDRRAGRGIPIIDPRVEPVVAAVDDVDTIESGADIRQPAQPEPVAPEAPSEPVVLPPIHPVQPRLVWPPEEQRVIIGMRLVGPNGEMFTGGSLRQALQGEGFVHGELDIFHRALADGRVIFSAASLTRPGNFDPNTMDSNLFLGLNLFAVLPGALSGGETIDRLIGAAQMLAQRLRGELQDSRGAPLTEARIVEMRRDADGAGIPLP
jgi:cell division protein ZipA